MTVLSAVSYGIFILALLFVMIALVRTQKAIKNMPKPKRKLDITYSVAMGILNEVIQECLAERMFTLRFNEKPTIPPLDDELIYMTKKILNSLSPELMGTLQMYLSNEFITRYISRNIREVCMQYIEEVRSK